MRFIIPLAESVENGVSSVVNDISAVPEGTFDKLMYGLNIALIGLGTVFSVLIILMVVLYLFKLFFYKKPVEENSANATAAAVKAEPETSAATNNEDELIPVVIAAAVAAYMEQSAPRSKYRIRSFKRI